jgi:hypothetical protein
MTDKSGLPSAAPGLDGTSSRQQWVKENSPPCLCVASLFQSRAIGVRLGSCPQSGLLVASLVAGPSPKLTTAIQLVFVP